MSFAGSITRVPLPHDRRAAAEALEALPGTAPELRDLLAGTAGCSPHLCGLMIKEAAWLEEALTRAPSAVLDELLAGLAPGETRAVARDLRVAKRRVALLTALADLGGVWDLDKVTGALTRLADTALDVAFRTALAGPIGRGKLPGLGAEALADSGGLVALAMGKMGAHELNYSSDIDLIILFDDLLFGSDDLAEARAVMVKAVRQSMALLSEITPDGYVFRTDLRLRPDPSVTPVAVSISAAERYYEALGRTWERAAFIKARPCAGALPAGRRFLKAIRPFIWRRHLDYTTVEDAHEMRQKIRAHKAPGGQGTLSGRNVKLGPGGIREIEFFTQTRQLIAGGRDRDLRVRGTREGLARLVARGWVGREEASVLDTDYVRLREIEHRLQMVQDAQTHDLPSAPEAWDRLAAFTGTGDTEALKDELRTVFARVYRLTEDFFAPDTPRRETVETSEETERIVERWNGYPALRTDRAQAIFARLRPRLLAGFQRSANPGEALVAFDGFLKGLPAGVQLFALFDANPQLIDLMVDICATSPALSQYLSQHSGVLDAVIGGAFFEAWPGVEALAAQLAHALAEPDLDYERQLDAARHWQKDWHFRIGVHHLRGLIGPDEAAAQYSDLAEAVLRGIWAAVCAEFGRKHGGLPGNGAIVVGLGSLGARELSAGSDLDLIVIYDAETDAESDGKRPLAARVYYARLTKALVTALSAQMAGGTLYEVDMRLRPSGRQGPAATGWAAYRSYQCDEAWTWEHLALTRARVMAGQAALAETFEAFRRQILSAPREAAGSLADLADMRRRLGEAKPRTGPWDVINGAGGLQDIALLAQAQALLSGSAVRDVAAQLALTGGPVAPGAAQGLAEAHALFAAVKTCTRLLTEGGLDPEGLGEGALAMLLRDTGAADVDALATRIDGARRAAAEIIDTCVPEPAAKEGETDDDGT